MEAERRGGIPNQPCQGREVVGEKTDEKVSLIAARGWPSLKEPFVSRASWRDFWHTFCAKVRSGLFLRCFVVLFLHCGFRVDGGYGLSFRGCRAVLFACGCTPTHPFVNPSAGYDGWPGPNLTPSILLRPSRAAWPSQSDRRSAAFAESRGHLRLTIAGEGLFFIRRRADATIPFLRIPSLIVPGFSLALCGSTIRVPGEAESGSAGTQPDEE